MRKLIIDFTRNSLALFLQYFGRACFYISSFLETKPAEKVKELSSEEQSISFEKKEKEEEEDVLYTDIGLWQVDEKNTPAEKVQELPSEEHSSAFEEKEDVREEEKEVERPGVDLNNSTCLVELQETGAISKLERTYKDDSESNEAKRLVLMESENYDSTHMTEDDGKISSDGNDNISILCNTVDENDLDEVAQLRNQTEAKNIPDEKSREIISLSTLDITNSSIEIPIDEASRAIIDRFNQTLEMNNQSPNGIHFTSNFTKKQNPLELPTSRIALESLSPILIKDLKNRTEHNDMQYRDNVITLTAHDDSTRVVEEMNTHSDITQAHQFREETDKHHIQNAAADVEARVQELLQCNSRLGIEKMYKQLVDEGFKIKKKRLRILKRQFLSEEDDGLKSEEQFNARTFILSRQKDELRFLNSSIAEEYFEKGKEATDHRQYRAAIEFFTEALKHKDDETFGPNVKNINLAYLYDQRSWVYHVAGFFHEALQDSLKIYICNEADWTRPILAHACALDSLGFHKDALKVLNEAKLHYQSHFPSSDPDEIHNFNVVLSAFTDRPVLKVGKDKEFKSIKDALNKAPYNSEILVEPGVYRESIIIRKPVTLRCEAINDNSVSDFIENGGHSDQKELWAEIKSEVTISIYLPDGKGARLIGFKVYGEGPPSKNSIAINAVNGTFVIRNCVLTSNSGPVVCSARSQTNVIMQSCAIHNGSQGGILADGGRISLHNIYCYNNAASGLELRKGGYGTVDESHFYGNGLQGISSWMKSGELQVSNCKIYSHHHESGILVGEGKIRIKNCEIFDNVGAGIVAQQGSILDMERCHVHNNFEGILIQNTAIASIRECLSYSNKANGIFIGYDHTGTATLMDNVVENNYGCGILIGSNRNVKCRGNKERKNLLLPPPVPQVDKTLSTVRVRSSFRKGVKKNRRKGGMSESQFHDLFRNNEILRTPSGGDILNHEICAYCFQPASKRCSRCRCVYYCSEECIRKAWPEHKIICRKTITTAAKYPQFLNINKSL